MKKPSCSIGYTIDDLQEILGNRFKDFKQFMIGQTMGICDGRSYNHEKNEYQDTGCGPHGIIVYRQDLQQFLGGGNPLD